MNSSLKVIPLDELKLLASKVNEYATRYDVPEEGYQSLLTEQESYYEFLQKNPNCYGNKNDWDQANTQNRFICLMLMLNKRIH
jgi:hypothetical protein